MSKHIEKLKNELAALAPVVNAFRSEAVQVRIVDWLLQMIQSEIIENETANLLLKSEPQVYPEGGNPVIEAPKKVGATKLLNELLPTQFFNRGQSIAAIVDHCNRQFGSEVKASKFSGVLLKLVKENRLKREKNGNDNHFEYTRA